MNAFSFLTFAFVLIEKILTYRIIPLITYPGITNLNEKLDINIREASELNPNVKFLHALRTFFLENFR